MVKIKPESQINENELLSKSLICRQNIVRELRNNKENFNGIIRIYKDYIKKFDAITFVPLGKNRFFERGYNQSELIAKTISKILNIKLIENMIIRKKETYPLSMIKDKELRKKTIKGAFVINKNFKLENSKKINILIIDDVFTTGTTLNEISFEIRKIENIDKIGVLTVARVN